MSVSKNGYQVDPLFSYLDVDGFSNHNCTVDFFLFVFFGGLFAITNLEFSSLMALGQMMIATNGSNC